MFELQGIETTVVVTLVVGVVVVLVRVYYLDPLKHVPGPTIARFTPLWLWYISWRGTECTAIAALHKKYGSVVRVAPNEVDISDGRAGHQIYVKNGGYLKSPVYRNIDVNGFITLFSAVNPAHRAPRAKAVAPLFAQQQVIQNRAHAQQVIAQMLKELERRKAGACGQPVDVLNLFRAMFIDTVSLCLLGESLNSVGKNRCTATDFVDRFASSGRFFLLPGWLFHKIEHWAHIIHKDRHTVDASIQHVQDFAARVVDRSIAKQKPEDRTYQGRLLNGGISREETIAQVIDILFAGTDGVGSTLSQLAWFLADHPQKYERVHEEVINNSDLDAQALPYLTSIVKESLRLSMANPTRLPRIVPPGGMRVDGLPFIPAGTGVGLSAYNLHLNSEVFAEPHAFLPERWLNPSAEMLRDSFYFGQGSRQCIARNFAWAGLCWAAEGLIRSGVLRGAKSVKGDAEIYQWFNSISRNGKRELVWED
ncbi:cytochrome P450 [Nemania sp. FL0031]|nr:cytochrome P450 [Nemania sp. FL0031]